MENLTDTTIQFAENSNWAVAILIFFSIQGTLGNVLIILAVAMDARLRAYTDAFIVNVAIMDIFVTGVILPTMVPLLIFERNVYGSFCTVSSLLLFS